MPIIIRQCAAAGMRLSSEGSDPAWNTACLRELIDHIVEDHHAHLRSELRALEKLTGATAPRLYEGDRVAELICVLKEDLELQMQKEEIVLFPAILELESASREGRRFGHSKFGSVRNLVKVAERSHSQTLQALEEIRRLTNNYCCQAKHTSGAGVLFRRLADLEDDLLWHIHLEIDILFGRVAVLEGETQ